MLSIDRCGTFCVLAGVTVIRAAIAVLRHTCAVLHSDGSASRETTMRRTAGIKNKIRTRAPRGVKKAIGLVAPPSMDDEPAYKMLYIKRVFSDGCGAGAIQPSLPRRPGTLETRNRPTAEVAHVAL